MTLDRGGAGRDGFGLLLRQLREARSLTQEGLAARSKVSVRAIQDLESGRRRHPQFHTVDCLVTGLALTGSEREVFVSAARSRPEAKDAFDDQPPLGEDEANASDATQVRQASRRRRYSWVALTAVVVMVAVALWLSVPALRPRLGVATPPPTPIPTKPVQILAPTDGAVIPGSVRVHGRASLPTGFELWLLLQPQHGDTRYIGTTPAPITVDASGAWMAMIRVGRGPQDGGYPFRLFAVVSPIGGGVERHVKLLPKGQRYPKMAEIPDDCSVGDQIEVTRVR